MVRLLAQWLVVVLTVGAGATAHAGGMPLRTYETMTWVENVLRQEAPRLDPETRRTVARTVAEEARHANLDPALVLAVMKVESRYRPAAVSHKGAHGIMQVMPRVARTMTQGAVDARGLLDPETNIRLGVALLSRLIVVHKGSVAEGLAAYNMGSRKVRTLMRRNVQLKAQDFRYARAVLREAGRIKRLQPAVTLAMADAPARGWLTAFVD